MVAKATKEVTYLLQPCSSLQGTSLQRHNEDHGEEGDVAADLDTAHVDLDNGSLAVGVVQSDGLVRRGRHEGPLDTTPPGRTAVLHPELVGQ